MIMLKTAKRWGLTLSLENTFFKKPYRGNQVELIESFLYNRGDPLFWIQTSNIYLENFLITKDLRFTYNKPYDWSVCNYLIHFSFLQEQVKFWWDSIFLIFEGFQCQNVFVLFLFSAKYSDLLMAKITPNLNEIVCNSGYRRYRIFQYS